MRTVVLAPHNDDETLFACFETLRRDADVVVCLRSSRMGTPGYPEPLIDSETRERETERAMNVLGLDWSQWPHLDSAPDWDEIAADVRTLRRFYGRCLAPAVEAGGHDQHNRIGELALSVWGPEKVTPYLTYTHPSQRSTWGKPVAHEDEWLAAKLEALACYESQAAHPMTHMHFSGDQTEYVDHVC